MLKTQRASQKGLWTLTPVFGTIIFIMLYITATHFYPGGSQVEKNAVGFSWVNNYWCNLLNEDAMNGQHNTAKPIALAGMFTLCAALTFFWWLFPQQARLGKKLRLVIQLSGTISMLVAFFLFTRINHDIITDTASLFGLVATIGTFIGLYKIRWYKLFAFGLVNILLVVVNSYVYYHAAFIIYLPVIQKITFCIFLIWICCITIRLYCTGVGSDNN